MAASKPDVTEMFEKMGQKLGWFKHKDLDTALKALSGSSKKKPSRLRLKKASSSAESCDDNNGRKDENGVQNRSTKDLAEKSSCTRKGSENSNIGEKETSNMKVDLLKALSFKGMLSSDSDSSDCEVNSGLKKRVNPKAVLQLASDSEDETSFAREDTYVSCIGESPLKSGRPSLIPVNFDTNNERKSASRDDYEETILKSRVSMATFSLDLDNIGEPLVESTRIHRRSSVSYKQIISPDTSEDSIRGMDTSPRLQEQHHQIHNEIENNELLCSKLDNLTLQKSGDCNVEDVKLSELSDIDDARYMTAVENLKGLDDGNIGDKNPGEKVKVRSKYSNANKHQKLTLDIPEILEESDIEVEEEVEVVDIATQTEEIVLEIEHDAKAHMSVLGVEMAYDVAVYDQETVHKDVSDDDTRITDTMSELSAYEQSTLHKVRQTAQLNRSQANAECSPEQNPNDSDITDNKSNSSPQEQSSPSMKDASDDDNVSVDGSTKSLEDSRGSTDSVVEVIDIGTQTESSTGCLNNTVNEDRQDHLNEDCDAHENSNKESLIIEDSDNLTRDFKSLENENSDISQDVANVDDNSEQNLKKDQDEVEESVEPENKSGDNKKSSGNFSLLSSDSDDGELNFSKLRQKAESRDIPSQGLENDERNSDRSVTTNQSWRAKKRHSSESSDDDDDGKLEAFFQKLRKPEKEKKEKSDSDHSRGDGSLDEFIVEDDDMTSESDDSAFYLRETQKLEEASLAERLKRNKALLVNKISNQVSDEEEDEVFSSKLYPDSVTKHKKKTSSKPKQTPRSWSFSSDSSNSSCNSSPQQKQGTGEQRKKNQKPSEQKTSTDNLTKKMTFEDLSSDSDSSDDGQPLFKTPNPLRKTKRTVPKTGKENVKGSEFNGMENANAQKVVKSKTPKSKPLTGYISLSDSDSDDISLPSFSSVSSSTDISKSNVSDQDNEVFYKLPTPVSKGRQPKIATPLATRGGCTYSFLKSLSSCVEDEGRRHPDAVKYVKNLKKTREDLTTHLFSLYNRTIFEGKLPSDLSVLWNKRLLRTAGYCAYKYHRGNKEDRTARVELSTKVCDSAERVRDTLIHELCHAAVWLLNGVNGGHGPFWKYWARQSSKMHPELPAISRCHSYSINTKFTYKCSKCGYSIGRHSKSLNTEKKVCGYCHGTFELIQNGTPSTPMSAARSASSSISSTPATPRTPNRFALFVKENYNTVKQKDKTLKHGDVMKELSKLFAESKITN